MKVYACLYGWIQFVTTDPNHWCRLKTEGVEMNKTDWLEYETGKIKVITNASDVPSRTEVNMYGFKLKYNEQISTQ